jgi:hypothetical protein
MPYSGNYFCYKFYLVITVREKWQPNEPNVLVNLVKHTGQMAEAKCIAGESASTMSNIYISLLGSGRIRYFDPDQSDPVLLSGSRIFTSSSGSGSGCDPDKFCF